MLYLTYSTDVNFRHCLAESPKVVDKACLKLHSHDAKLTIKIPYTTWMDFKEMARRVQLVLNSGLSGNIGVMDTETYLLALKEKLGDEFLVPADNLILTVQETSKYGCEWIPDAIVKKQLIPAS